MKFKNQRYKHSILTDNEVDVLYVARNFRTRNGYSATYSEIAALTGMKKWEVAEAMTALENFGLIKYQIRRARGYIVTQAGMLMKVSNLRKNNGKKKQMYNHYELSDVQVIVLLDIIKMTNEVHIPPTFNEVAERAGLDSTAAVAAVVKGLRQKGYLEPMKDKQPHSRVLIPTAKAMRLATGSYNGE